MGEEKERYRCGGVDEDGKKEKKKEEEEKKKKLQGKMKQTAEIDFRGSSLLRLLSQFVQLSAQKKKGNKGEKRKKNNENEKPLKRAIYSAARFLYFLFRFGILKDL